MSYAKNKHKRDPRIAFISLGCAKNTVDTEKALNNLWELGFTPVADPQDADALVINTCGFLETALEEAKEVLKEVKQLKDQGSLKYIMVLGCGVSRNKQKAESFFNQADGIYPLGTEKKLLKDLANLFKLRRSAKISNKRSISITLPHTAYLKVSEGCSRFCSFCTIPSIRGKYHSRPKEDLLAEAKALASRGVKELILIAQDTTAYGTDLYKKPALTELLKSLISMKKFHLIRIMYAYPEFFNDSLIDLWVNDPVIANYLDLPIQHSHPEILRKMNRKDTFNEFDRVFNSFRKKNSDFCIRTTVITGFPGEEEEHFNNLCNYIEKTNFTRLGAFAYSPEKGTPAAKLSDFHKKIAETRRDKIMTIQQKIHFANNDKLIGQTEKVIIDGLTEKDIYLARTFRDAPEIDSVVLLKSKSNHLPGDMVLAKYTDIDNYDLIAEKAL